MKHIFVFDQSKCSACSACMMGCLDQNDTDVVGGDLCYRKTFDNEVQLADGSTYYAYISAACMHCVDAPCIPSCPVGCLSKDSETGFTVYDNTNCIGCKSCAMACPFGAPRLCKVLHIWCADLRAGGRIPSWRQQAGVQCTDRSAPSAEEITFGIII